MEFPICELCVIIGHNNLLKIEQYEYIPFGESYMLWPMIFPNDSTSIHFVK